MHVTLIDPVWDYDIHCMSEPLGILYLSAVLRQQGHTVSYVHTTYDELDQAMLRGSDLIGFYTSSPMFDNARILLKKVRQLAPLVPVVAGGPHCSVATEDALRAGFHAVFVGEAERSLPEFLDRLAEGNPFETRGIAYLDDDTMVRTPPISLVEDLDELPFPARDLFDYDRYLKTGGWEFGMMSGRGCPYRCTFCQPTIDLVFRKYRRRSPGNVAREMAEIYEHYEPPTIYFKDDTMAANGVRWFERFREELDSFGLNPTWKCNNRVDHADEDLVQAMVACGCEEMIFGVESGSQRILDFYDKGISVAQIEEAFATCRRHGVMTGANVVLGAPMETHEELELTFDLLHRIQPDNYWVFFLTALPGKHVTQYVVQHDLLDRDLGYHFYDTAVNGIRATSNIRTEHVTFDDLKALRERIFASMPGRQHEMTVAYEKVGYVPSPREVDRIVAEHRRSAGSDPTGT